MAGPYLAEGTEWVAELAWDDLSTFEEGPKQAVLTANTAPSPINIKMVFFINAAPCEYEERRATFIPGNPFVYAATRAEVRSSRFSSD